MVGWRAVDDNALKDAEIAFSAFEVGGLRSILHAINSSCDVNGQLWRWRLMGSLIPETVKFSGVTEPSAPAFHASK